MGAKQNIIIENKLLKLSFGFLLSMFCRQKNALCLVTTPVIGNIRLLLSRMCLVKLQDHYDDTCHQIKPGHLMMNPADAVCIAAQVRTSRRKTQFSECGEALKLRSHRDHAEAWTSW